jgi:4-alpha-glucanotransferase
MTERVAGVLAHPTSLPGPFGIGDFGPETSLFLDWVAEAGFGLWQILPLTPVGPGCSPYSSPSAFAGNPLLISPERLRDEGLLTEELPSRIPSPTGRVEYAEVARVKATLFRGCWERFRRSAPTKLRTAFEAFVDDPAQRPWLEDWALYATLVSVQTRQGLESWDDELRMREPGALARVSHELKDEIAYQRFLQFLFDRQWRTVRQRAHERGISILGDVPFYVARESADVWAHPELFRLDSTGRPTVVAGVPPDYFSETGQLWGNPIFNWQRLTQSGFEWWIDRLRANLRFADLLRLDHFRAFASYWVIERSSDSAIDGHWTDGPGESFFESVKSALGGLPFVAEDLGDIDEPVRNLRDRFDLPGMRVLQFGLMDDASEHHLNQHGENCVAYTGTHDNDTARGWYEALDPDAQHSVRTILGADSGEIARKLVEQTLGSRANAAIVPLQDFLGLGSDARMNRPGVEDDNWTWRISEGSLTLRLAAEIRKLIERTNRTQS